MTKHIFRSHASAVQSARPGPQITGCGHALPTQRVGPCRPLQCMAPVGHHDRRPGRHRLGPAPHNSLEVQRVADPQRHTSGGFSVGQAGMRPRKGRATTTSRHSRSTTLLILHQAHRLWQWSPSRQSIYLRIQVLGPPTLMEAVAGLRWPSWWDTDRSAATSIGLSKRWRPSARGPRRLAPHLSGSFLLRRGRRRGVLHARCPLPGRGIPPFGAAQGKRRGDA